MASAPIAKANASISHASSLSRWRSGSRGCCAGSGFSVIAELVDYMGGCVQRKKGRYAWANKNVVLTLVERGGAARSFHIDGVRAGEILPIIRENLSREARLMTDEMSSYKVIAEI